jgi:RNA polymerase sigma-70 factor (ECF subfamily)
MAPTIGATVSYAAALGKAGRPKDGLNTLLAIEEKVRAGFAPAHATRAYLLSELGRIEDAVAAYESAIALTPEPPLRRYLQMKSKALRTPLN